MRFTIRPFRGLKHIAPKEEVMRGPFKREYLLHSWIIVDGEGNTVAICNDRANSVQLVELLNRAAPPRKESGRGEAWGGNSGLAVTFGIVVGAMSREAKQWGWEVKLCNGWAPALDIVRPDGRRFRLTLSEGRAQSDPLPEQEIRSPSES